MPRTNREFWRRKFDANQTRDRGIRLRLTALGWRVVILWECETRCDEYLENRWQSALESR